MSKGDRLRPVDPQKFEAGWPKCRKLLRLPNCDEKGCMCVLPMGHRGNCSEHERTTLKEKVDHD